MKPDRMHAETFAVLRHIEVHGPRSKVEICKGTQQPDKEVAKRLANLLMLGYLAADTTVKPANFILTGKARLKLADPHALRTPAPQPKPKKPKEAPEPAMSAAQVSRLAKRISPKLHLNPHRARSSMTVSALSAPYRATEYSPSPRPGANDALALPSRFGDQLHYRDGRITDMDGNPLP